MTAPETLEGLLPIHRLALGRAGFYPLVWHPGGIWKYGPDVEIVSGGGAVIRTVHVKRLVTMGLVTYELAEGCGKLRNRVVINDTGRQAIALLGLHK